MACRPSGAFLNVGFRIPRTEVLGYYRNPPTGTSPLWKSQKMSLSYINPMGGWGRVFTSPQESPIPATRRSAESETEPLPEMRITQQDA